MGSNAYKSITTRKCAQLHIGHCQFSSSTEYRAKSVLIVLRDRSLFTEGGEDNFSFTIFLN